MRSEETLPGDIVLRHLARLGVAALIATFFAIMWTLFDTSETFVSRAVIATLGDPARTWELENLYLLLALPLGATMVVFVRSVLGLQTFGLFTPMLLALSYLQSGPIVGPTISIAAILVGMLSAPFLRWLRLSRVAFLGALISIVVTALGAMAIHLQQSALISAFPVVVTALVVERWWNAWEVEGPRKAMRLTVTTLAIAVLIQALVAAPPLIALAATAPLALPITSVILMILLGRYHGLRLSEIARFRAAKGD
jgi:hypothetical protein